MCTASNKSKVAIVGRGGNLTWFDTMPGEQMAVRLHSRDVGGAFTIIEARVPPFIGPPLHFHKERERYLKCLKAGFAFTARAKSSTSRLGQRSLCPVAPCMDG
jgi:hypothetical protein